MKKLHELSDKAQRKAIKTIRELLGCGYYINNYSIFDYCKKKWELDLIIVEN